MVLLDVGVWLAALWGRHIHHRVAAGWLDEQSGGVTVCRVTQLGLLRLLSNRSIMGEDALTRRDAWRTLDQIRSDDRVAWAEEPKQLDVAFRVLSARNEQSHQLWTDDYLAAFAQASNATLVTLDTKLPTRYPSASVQSLL